MEEKEIDFKFYFFNSEMFLGKIKANSEEKNVLFRTNIFDDKFHFLLYDFCSLYYSNQEFDNISKYHLHENPSIEFKDTLTLIEFIQEKILKVDDENRTILQEDNSFIFENFVNIIKVKWRFECDITHINTPKVSDIIQNLFVKPLLNTLLSIQGFFEEKNSFNMKSSKLKSNEASVLYVGDILPVLGTNLISQNRNFNNNMCTIIKESTINCNEIYLNKLEERSKINLKRINKETKLIKGNVNTKKKKEDEKSETSSQMAILSNENSMNSESYNISKKKEKQNGRKVRNSFQLFVQQLLKE